MVSYSIKRQKQDFNRINLFSITLSQLLYRQMPPFIKAASGDRVIEKRLRFNISQRFAFLAHELFRIIARGLRLKRCFSGHFQYSVKSSVVLYCIDVHIEGRRTQIEWANVAR